MISTERMAFAQALHQFRMDRKLTQPALAKLVGASPASVQGWESAKSYPGPRYIEALKKAGFIHVENEDAGDEAINIEADKAADEIARLLSLGSPLAEVYSKAMQAQAGFLKGEGLSGGRKRTWDTLLKTIKDAIAERKGHEPIEAHPQWPDVKTKLCNALTPYPEALRAVIEALGGGDD